MNQGQGLFASLQDKLSQDVGDESFSDGAQPDRRAMLAEALLQKATKRKAASTQLQQEVFKLNDQNNA